MELEIRKNLGIPEDAKRVLIFGESSHWDINWMFTSESYYNRRIRHIIDKVLKELENDSHRIYSIESVFFLKMYWDRNPGKRESLRFLINKGRIRLTGSGYTTPDTILPETESIIRDYLYGQEWLRDNNMYQEPKLAYLPDNFGNSPNLPGLLKSLGYEYTSVARIDGMHFPGSDYAIGKFPLPGSSAELLGKKLMTSDFVWRGLDGSEVLCHWNAFTYGHGDTLDLIGVAKFYDIKLGIPCRWESHIARKINKFVHQLSSLAKTPYLFCPIGMDFNSPIPDLGVLINRYNENSYPNTGTFVVNASMEDYMDLINQHRHQLPIVNHDPNPYWMGFYTSRPGLKQKCSDLALDLVKAEKMLFIKKNPLETYKSLGDTFKKAWEITILTNHHDFITGTSPNRIWKKEQMPWLHQARELTNTILDSFKDTPLEKKNPSQMPPPKWKKHDRKLTVENSFYTIVMDEKQGGAIVSWKDKKSDKNFITGPSNDIVTYKDTGGLWRLGHEFNGGTFKNISKCSDSNGSINIAEYEDILKIIIVSELEERTITRTLWFRNDSPIVKMRITGSAIDRRTLTCLFNTTVKSNTITMKVPGGIIERPIVRNYNPTYWPHKGFAFQMDNESNTGFFIGMGVPGNIHSNGEGNLQWIAIRNTSKERAFGILPVPAHPASGANPQIQNLDYAVCFSESHNWHQYRIQLLQALDQSWINPSEPGVIEISKSIIEVDNEDVRVMAMKPADRGDGIIVRLLTLITTIDIAAISFKKSKIKKAWLTDARERDITDLAVKRGKVFVPISGFITTIRILF